ncbi:hypothetical protein [Kitasatospora sp. NPDC098663]|uniref:hypothetical protein n=1 Tax=Kitasatospora sp. NPDC098663 TaxID=3364096 RepID=UPI0037FC89BD
MLGAGGQLSHIGGNLLDALGAALDDVRLGFLLPQLVAVESATCQGDEIRWGHLAVVAAESDFRLKLGRESLADVETGEEALEFATGDDDQREVTRAAGAAARALDDAGADPFQCDTAGA